ncbi:MAG TPA: alginate export family protein [bacterium]|nr:alginate export family protein [bacterium]
MTTAFPPLRNQPMTRPALRDTVAFGSAGILIILLLSASPLPAATVPELPPGTIVAIKPYEHRVPLTARTLLITGQPIDEGETVSLSLRAPIEGIATEESQMRIAGRTVAISSQTRVPAGLRSVTNLRRGQWVKVKIDTSDPEHWSALRIETENIDRRRKIEGPVSGLWRGRDGAIDSVSVAGLVVAVSPTTRIDDHMRSASERLFDELVTARDPRQPGPWWNAGWIWSRGKLGVIQRIENDFTAGDSTGDRYREAEPSVRLELTARGPARLTAFAKLRARQTAVIEDAPLRRRPKEKVIQLYEAFVLWRDAFSLPLAVQIGRQDFDEYREWIFDDQLDALRFYAYPLYPVVAEAAYINSLDNSTGNKYRTTKDYLIHLHCRVNASTELGAYRLWRTDTDARGREPIWTGVRWRGNYFGFRPWGELAWLGGWDKGRRFDAHATDLGLTASRQLGSRRVSVTVAHARGSGNSDDPKATGVDHQFIQTGYEDNTSAFGGVVSFQYYGEIFDPELANLDILTYGAGVGLTPSLSVDVVYHRYRQSEYSPTVSRDLESTDLTLYDLGGRGIDPSNNRPVKELFPYPHVGWEIDVIIGMTGLLGVLDVKGVLGYFEPQEALFPPFWEELPFKSRKHAAFLSQINLEYRF